MKKIVALLVAAGLALAGQAHADGFSYTYVDFGFGYVQGKNGGSSRSGNAVRVTWAWEMTPHTFFLLDGGGTSYDVYDPDLDQKVKLSPGVLSLGFGYDRPLAPDLDVTAGISWDTLNLEAQQYDEFRNARYFHGWGVNLGLRGRIGKRLQWTAVARYSDVEHVNAISGFTLGSRYNLTQRIGVGFDLFVRQYDRNPVDLKESGAMLFFRYEGIDRY
jgi:hypothetical protein